MKMLRSLLISTLIPLTLVSVAHAAPATFTLNPLTSFGPNGDGSIRPGQSIGTSPTTGNDVQISAPGGYGIQPGDSTAAPISTNGFNMRGLAFDPVTKNLVLVDTHSGSGGSGTCPNNAAIYILNADSGQIVGALSTNGISGGSYTHVAAGVADDGVVYVANQVNKNSSAYKIYRWPTANPSDPDFAASPIVAYSNTAPNFERIGLTMAVRGAGTNTQILVGTADPAKTGTANALSGTNVFLFTTGDGTNFVHHRLYVPGLNSGFCNDGIAFGPANTFWTKEVGSPLYYLAYDPATITNDVASTNTCTLIASYTPSSPNDPLLNLSAIAVDNTNHLLAGLEEIGGTATGGNGKVWLYAIPDPTNRAPAILTPRVYIVNFQKTTAPMGYLAFGNGRLYAHASNNGFLVNTVDSVPMPAPSYTWTDYDLSGFAVTRVADLPATTRAAVGQTAHFEVLAVPAVTNYQWYTNNVPIPGANSYYLDVPNVQTSQSGTIYRVVAFNAAGSTNSVNSTLTVVSVADFFHLEQRWSFAGGTTNYITAGGAGTPNERCIAYNALSNQLLVVRGPAAFASLRIFVVDPGTGSFLYLLNTNGMTSGGALNLCGIGVADDGAVYACSVNAAGTTDQSFRVYRWENTDSNTAPQLIYGTSSSAASGNPVADLTGTQLHRFGDALAVRGSGINTEIVVDNQNGPTKYAAVLRPLDGTMTNWASTPLLLQNILGSYGSGAYGTIIGRSIQFGNGNTFWQKRPNIAAATGANAGAPVAQMGYTPAAGAQVAPLLLANMSLPIFNDGPVALNLVLNVAAGINFGAGALNADTVTQDRLDYYDITDPGQAVYLSSVNLPNGAGTTRKANNNEIAQVIFGYDPATGTNYVFAITAGNGISGFVLAGGTTPPPKFLSQPANLRVLEGGSGTLSAIVDQTATVQWFKGTNPPVSTGVSGSVFNIANAAASSEGDYFVIATNINGSATSQVAHVSVGLTNDNYTLSQVWAAGPGDANFPYVTSTGGPNTPNERSFAYNALSNQLIVVKCPPSSTAYALWVVDAGTGSNLYTLNTTGVIAEGSSEVSGSNPIDLVAAAAADDGAIYICSETPNASGGALGDTTKMLHVYRWADSGPTTVPVMVYQGDPSAQPPGLNVRWGDVMAARGSGTNTELILNSQEGSYGAVLKPTDSSMTLFTNYWFFDSAGAGSIGRSIQFGPTNTVFEKRKGAPLFYSSYNTNSQSSVRLGTVSSSTTLGGVFVDTAHSLAAGVDFVGSTSKPDAVALYEISDPTTPMLIKTYSFPSNQVANANFICQTVVAGWKVFSLDANNGLMAFYIDPPVNSMILRITQADTSHVNLSWGNSAAVLQGTTNLVPSSWIDLTAPGQTNSLQPMVGGGISYYRVIQRR